MGSSHDFAIFKDEKIARLLPAKIPVYVDTGFEGAHNLAQNVNFRKPKKKPKNKNLNGGERLGNRLISRTRVKVEHAIGNIKRYKSIAGICRNISKSMNETFQVVCGLINFQIDRRAKNQCFSRDQC